MDIRSIKPAFTDSRGEIIRLFEIRRQGMRSVLCISSKKGAVRANHYHKKDTHYTYLVSGKFTYAEKGLGRDDKTQSVVVKPGDMVKTLPRHIHAMKFLADSLMIIFTSEPRDQAAYERDTIRVTLTK